MTERLIDAVCPHCGRVGTTVRVVLNEDGFTKLSRRCTDCGGECVHTFDHDWLADAKNKKLQADNERLTRHVALVSERVRQLSDERDYAWGEVEKQRAEIERLRAEMQSAKADAWDEGHQDHKEMIDGIARKPSNPYR
jgi:hypothetical protein